MIVNVKLYKNTGLTPNNSLDSPTKLDSLGFESLSCPDIAVKQDRDLTSVRLNITYSAIRECDYCKINNQCYWITNINMLNDNVAELSLLPDYMTTVGVDNINIISGWCTRRHVNIDNYGDNTIPEPFIPSDITRIVLGGELKPSGDNSSKQIIVSTVDIREVTDTAKTYSDPESTEQQPLFVIVPKIPNVSTNTTYTLEYNNVVRTTNLAGTSAFDASNDDIKQGLVDIYALGLDTVVLASYIIPGNYIGAIAESGGLISSIASINDILTSNINVEYQVDIKNKKAFSGQFQRIHLLSLTSGEDQEYMPEDIIDADGNIKWELFADLRYNGVPVCKPFIYHGSSNTYMLGAVKGSEWMNTPIKSYGAQTVAYTQMGVERAKALINVVGGFDITKPLSTVNSVVDVAELGFKERTEQLQYSIPRLSFPQIPTLQNYVGNNFFDYVERLSSLDLIRFDNYLTQFGYAVNEPLTDECFTGRVYFNYVQAEQVNLNIPYNLSYKNGVIQAIQAGVRIWHTIPNISAMTNNPIGG